MSARRRRSSPSRKARSAPAATSRGRFDRGAYALPPVDLEEAVALATQLLRVKPPRPSAAVAEELRDLAMARDAARDAAGDGAESSPLAARPFDVAMDLAWETFVRRIVDHATLPRSRYPIAREAARVAAIVEDLSILEMNYLAEFAQIGARLDALKREGLLEQARALAGDAFLDEVLRCHAAYGEALGLGRAPPAPSAPGTDAGTARRALVAAIGEYAIQVMAQARAGRPDTWKAVRSALAPIARLRESQREGRDEEPRRTPAAHP